VHGKGSASSIAPFAILGGTSFLGGWSLRTALPTVLPRHLGPPDLGAVLVLALLALAVFLACSTQTFSMISRSWSIALTDSGTVLWFISYWFLHSVRHVARMIPAAVASLNGMFPFLVEATTYALSLSVSNMVMYLFRVPQRLP
jgi:hypothetical protein